MVGSAKRDTVLLLPDGRGSGARTSGEGSGNDVGDLELEDLVPVETELLQDRVAVLVELWRPLGCGGLGAIADRRCGQLERCAGGGLVVLDVAVGDHLQILAR